MAHIDDARPRLRYIMGRRRAESWDEAELGFNIYEKLKGRRKLKKFFVPLSNVEAVERHQAEGTFLGTTNWTDLREVKD